jgi:hypothetical protein
MSVLDKGYHKTKDKYNKYYRHKCLCLTKIIISITKIIDINVCAWQRLS